MGTRDFAPEVAPRTTTASARRRLLIVDDDPAFRALMACALAADGADVMEGATGFDLLEWIEASSPRRSRPDLDLIVSDYDMPGINALDALGKAPFVCRRMPVILVSAVADEAVRRKAYELGVQVVLDKSIDVNDVRAVVRALARNASRSDRARPLASHT